MKQRVTRRRAVTGVGALVAGVSLAGCTGGGGGGGGKKRTVEMTDDLVFDPADLKIGVDETVVWENVGSVKHTVTAYEDKIPDDATYFASGGFESEQAARKGFPDEGAIAEGETYQHTFETTGTYEYFCIPHESADMTGTIEVSQEGPQL